MKGPLRFLALVAWGALVVFIGQQVGMWVRDAPGVAIPTLASLIACCAAAWGWVRRRGRQ